MACETRKSRGLRNIIFGILKMYPVFNIKPSLILKIYLVFNIKPSLYYNYIIGNAKQLNE